MLIEAKLPPQLFVQNQETVVEYAKMQPAKNVGRIKPKYGLWTSTYDLECGSAWVQWNLRERSARVAGLTRSQLKKKIPKEDAWVKGTRLYFNATVLTPKMARIWIIDTRRDLLELFEKYGYQTTGYFGQELQLDFEKMSQDFDAIHLTEAGQSRTRHGEPNLNGWDMESTFWFRWIFEESVKNLGQVGYPDCNMYPTETQKRILLGLEPRPEYHRRNPEEEIRKLEHQYQITQSLEDLAQWARALIRVGDVQGAELAYVHSLETIDALPEDIRTALANYQIGDLIQRLNVTLGEVSSENLWREAEKKARKWWHPIFLHFKTQEVSEQTVGIFETIMYSLAAAPYPTIYYSSPVNWSDRSQIKSGAIRLDQFLRYLKRGLIRISLRSDWEFQQPLV